MTLGARAAGEALHSLDQELPSKFHDTSTCLLHVHEVIQWSVHLLLSLLSTNKDVGNRVSYEWDYTVKKQ